MKKSLNIILAFSIIFFISAILISPCGIYGDNKNPKMMYNDSLKNRATTQQYIDESITLDKLFVPEDDTKRFNSSQYVSLIGYIALVKRGGSETCNCHSKDKADLDTHIELSLDSCETNNKKCIVCEVTRYNADDRLTYQNIKKLKGKKVQIEGYLFFDEEHKQNAVNTNPSGTNLWRASCWEIHPVCGIQTIK
jgi:hypothetical protein